LAKRARASATPAPSKSSPYLLLALHWRANLIDRDETVLKALKKIFGKGPAEQTPAQPVSHTV